MRIDIEPVAADWSVHPLGDVASITLGGTPSTLVPTFWGGSIPWMASGEVNLRHVWDVEGRITERGLAGSNATLVDPPTVAVGLAGQGRTRGTVALVYVRLCTNQSIALLQGYQDRLDTGYLFHNLDSRYEELRARSSGGGRGGLSRSILQDVPLAIPPIPEQRRIAEILDTLDEAIRKTDRVIAKLQQMKQGLLHDLLTRGIDGNGELRDPDRHPEQFKDSPLGRIPRGWEVDSFGRCISGSPQNGLYKPSSHYGETGIPIVRIDAFYDGVLSDVSELKRLRLTPAEAAAYAVAAGDILVNRVNSIDFVGKAALVPDLPELVVFESNIMRCRLVSDRLLPQYAIRWLVAPWSRRYFHSRAKSAIAQASVNQGDVRAMPLAVPPVFEQELVAALAAQTDVSLSSEERNLAKLRTLKHGLMDDLLTGRVRVPDAAQLREVPT